MDGLLAACRSGNIDKVNDILSTSPDLLNCRDQKNNTPLIVAMKWKHGELARLLIDKGADIHAINTDEEFPLFLQ